MSKFRKVKYRNLVEVQKGRTDAGTTIRAGFPNKVEDRKVLIDSYKFQNFDFSIS